MISTVKEMNMDTAVRGDGYWDDVCGLVDGMCGRDGLVMLRTRPERELCYQLLRCWPSVSQSGCRRVRTRLLLTDAVASASGGLVGNRMSD
jgi:hypothetical protein